MMATRLFSEDIVISLPRLKADVNCARPTARYLLQADRPDDCAMAITSDSDCRGAFHYGVLNR